MERVPVSQEFQSAVEVVLSWLVGSRPLEEMPMTGRMGCSLVEVRCKLLETQVDSARFSLA